MNKKEKLNHLWQQMAVINRKIEETEKRMPAHSVKPAIMTQLFELEDTYDRIKKEYDFLLNKTNV